MAASGIDLVCVPNFADITIDGEQRTAIRLQIEDRHAVAAPDLDALSARDTSFPPSA